MKRLIIAILLVSYTSIISAQENEDIPIEDVTEEEIVEEVLEKNYNVPFAIVEEVPIYPGCEDLNKKHQRSCLINKTKEHVAKNFNLKIMGRLGLTSGKKKIYIQFLIDKNGEINEVVTRGPHEKAEKEAIRVVKLLPKMIPGKQRGRNVGVRYMLPISFAVE